MTTTTFTRPGDQTRKPSVQWNLATMAVIAFATGAALTNFTMRHVFENPLKVGQTEYRYFSDEDVARAFQKQFAVRNALSGGSTWMGVPTTQNPLDLWMLQEIITQVKPGAVIETGTGRGGSALAIATVLEGLKQGRVHSIDIQADGRRPAHDRISYYTGSSVDPKTVAAVRSQIRENEPVLVVLDSSHERPHVLRELKTYAPLVSVGSYLVVSNTQLNGHPLTLESELRHGVDGPYEAVEDFLEQNHDFEADRGRERFGVTANPMGWLKRVR